MTSSSQLPYNKGLAGWLRIYRLRVASNQLSIYQASSSDVILKEGRPTERTACRWP